MTEITIESEYIKLDQFLKLAEIASTGGHAKFLIQEGLVTVNDEIELRRGKKIKSGDIVEIEGTKLKVCNLLILEIIKSCIWNLMGK